MLEEEMLKNVLTFFIMYERSVQSSQVSMSGSISIIQIVIYCDSLILQDFPFHNSSKQMITWRSSKTFDLYSLF